jgi:hypothetical protein
MAKRKITVTMTVKEAAALCDAAIRGEGELEVCCFDEDITDKWCDLAGQGSTLLQKSLDEADPDWLEKLQRWQKEGA